MSIYNIIKQITMPYYENDNNDSNSLNSSDRLAESNRQLELNDKYFQRLRRNRLDEKKTAKRNDGTEYYKKVYVNAFGSGGHGMRIRNAVTGVKYPYLVGSRYQDKFFSVAICTGENGMKDSLSLFYDSPEQYESHMFSTIDNERKNIWHMNRNAMIDM